MFTTSLHACYAFEQETVTVLRNWRRNCCNRHDEDDKQRTLNILRANDNAPCLSPDGVRIHGCYDHSEFSGG